MKLATKYRKNIFKGNKKIFFKNNSSFFTNKLYNIRTFKTNVFEYEEPDIDYAELRKQELANTPVPIEFDNAIEAEEYVYQMRAQMIQKREKELKDRQNLKKDVRLRLLPKVKKVMSESKDPEIRDRHLYNDEQLLGMEQQRRQITNVSIPELVVDVVGVREVIYTEDDVVQHLATRGIKFSDDDIVELLTIMLDKNMSEGHAAELAIDILTPYIGKGRVQETHWRDYLINGKPKTILENIAGRISRASGVPHMPLSMTRLTDLSNEYPQTEEEIIKMIEEMETDEKRPIWGKDNQQQQRF
eukprot:TRINITY_DN1069_c0_g1_i1.p1 TRINITY_DN1069_c0_g1~~TRINITY_DN1069_c0_g1_i1.p1  ORF type:complete len:311 (-),score=102.81 TRINITY_DN1069_c0_g1_i1:96-998(-)